MSARAREMYFIFLSVVFLMIVNFPACDTAGRTVTINVDNNGYKYINDFNISPTGVSSLRGRYKGCKGMEILLSQEANGESLWILIGYYDNTLDAFYWKDWLDYTWVTSLDCDVFRDFWFSWDGNGGFKYGTGLEVGQNEVLSITVGPTGPMNYAKLGVIYANVTGIWEWIEDKPPKFLIPSADGTTEIYITESPLGQAIMPVGGIDPENDTLTFTLENYADKFEIVGTILNTRVGLDYEERSFYLLIIKLSDNPNEVKTSLLINVLDILDEIPIVTLADPAITIFEEVLPGTTVSGMFTVTDADEDDRIYCAIAGDDSQYISTVDNSCKELTVMKRIDFDGAAGRSVLDKLMMVVVDQGGSQVIKDFVIKIADVNDNVPTFAQSIYTVNMAENTAADTSLMDILATDIDSGNNKVLTYNISSGNDAAMFKITATTLFLAPAVSDIDYETNTKFVLTITAVDNPDEGVALTGSTTVIVNIDPVNEYTPTWSTAPSDLSLPEDTSPATLITTVLANDVDHGIDGDIFYEIVSVTDSKGRDSKDLFSLETLTGRLYLSKSLDFDDHTGGATSHTVVLKARDNNITPKSVESTFTITVADVNDLPPAFDQIKYSITVPEDKAVGTTVLTVAITEYDTSDTYTLSLNPADFFEIVGSDVKVLKTLDYETTRFYDLTIRATDGGGKHVIDVPLTVVISNVMDEPPVITVQLVYIQEEVPIDGVAINAGFKVTDVDEGDTLSYSLSGTDAHFFKINQQTGSVTLKENIDRDGTNGVTSLTGLSLTVTDSAGLSDTKSLNIAIMDINDNTPVFSKAKYDAEIAENSAADISVILLTVLDIDAGGNAVVVPSIQEGDDLGNFKMAGLELRTTAVPIDYEALKDRDYTFTLVIAGTDSPTEGTAKTGNTVINIRVLSQNEFDPQWVTAISGGSFAKQTVSEGDKPGATVATFEAADQDHGKDGEVVYGIVKETNNVVSGMFAINSETGVLSVAGALDVDTSTGGVPYYDVILSATDRGTPTRSVTGTVQIKLTGINDLPPVFTDREYSITVKESAAIDDVIMTINATDEDGDTVTYSVIGDLADGSGSDIILKKKLDYETKRVHVVTVQAKDGKHTTETLVTIKVEDIVDEAPVLTVYDNIIMPEEQLVGTIVGGLFEVKDADETDTFTYSIDGASSKYFSIDERTGTMKIKSRISREDGLQVLDEVRVTVTDAAGLSDSGTLSVTVKDVNDNPPTFSQTSYTATVTEASATASREKRATTLEKIFDFTVTDKDEGDNSNYVLSIGAGNVNDVFTIDGSSLMADTNKIDYEALEDQDYQYTLTILAVDTPTEGQPMTGTALITVKVNGVDEYDPEWSTTGVVPDATGTFPNVSLLESTGFGTVVVTLGAVDKDGGVDGQLHYKVVSITRSDDQTEENMFSFNSTGTLFTSSILDADISTGGTAYYVLVVAAVGGAGGKSVTGTMTIFLEDEPDKVVEPEQTAEIWIMRAMCVVLALVLAIVGAVIIKKMWPVPDIDPLPDKYERPDMMEPHKWAKELDLQLEDF